MGGYFRRTFTALTIREFRILWLGSLGAFVAFFMSLVVQADVAFGLTGENRAVGFVVFGQGLAMLFLNPVGGALADRVSKRLVVVTGQLVIFSVFLALGLLVASGTIRVLFLAAGSFLIGSSFSFLGPARQSWVIDLVDLRRRPNAVALNQVALNMGQVLGPTVAAVALSLAFLRAEGAYFTMAGLYLFAIAASVVLPSPVREGARSKTVFGDLVAGLRYLRSEPRLTALVGLFVLVLVVGFPYITVTRGLVENEFGRGSGAFGTLATAAAIGALSSSIVMAQFASSPRIIPIYLAMGVVFGAGLVAVGVSPSFGLAVLGMFVLGCGTGGFQALNSAVLVSEADPAYYGRVLSLTMLAFAGSSLVGLPLGILADAVGEPITLAAMGIGVLSLVGIFAAILARTGPSPVKTPAPPDASAPQTAA